MWAAINIPVPASVVTTLWDKRASGMNKTDLAPGRGLARRFFMCALAREEGGVAARSGGVDAQVTFVIEMADIGLTGDQ